ncbi:MULTISPECIES: flagellar hook-associated protein FlgK [Bradyrhizobium]|jgi:flagellar hook-associated protein 1 FlgK|uniref:Flagellar hook-associated protein 1 n=6 Tax=Pseudomonadota TaxID=1224 RepID=A0ABS5GA63_9BRAD|nr:MULTISPECIES: flagellar hook-associated protein FlgK [Bradyrhizobium]MBR1138217.1 flagellar hook-associated protein FlgK [Bradyrhizobium denitrificans]MDU1496413.1 flagellar hook-associated protein FlgK [Bradyrhizobium sp.]MDU1546553.1 flagellar hook-associated protein FlgK [Bradyrhizobium sp.]MDU1807266.1 flagellar hook-associated protein FlgK [Bradyrhizobium sp.]MDU2927071.1 flagellar hook-associated protein FlgK [Bradyrhizobium sp.]
MSLDIARLVAFSGISATELQISVASSNISNADTKGYTEKLANQVATVTGGVGTGVSITGISSNVDKLLLKSLIGANSELGAADTTNSYLEQLQQLFGSASTSGTSTTGTSLANALASLESALSSLASSPSSVSLQSAAVSALDDFASQLRSTSSGVQSLRANSDKDIASSVKSVNDDLQQIADLNVQIRKMAAAGQSTADLEDQRNSALQDLSSYMNVSYYTASNGDLQVYTSSGRALVDSSAHTLSYTASANVSASSSYSSGGFSGIMVDGVDVTSQITSGKIGALITLRDQTLPATQTQLDQLATELKSALNAITNGASAVPPPTSLTGSASVSSTTALAASGTVRIAVADQSGNLVSYKDLDLSSYATVGDLVTALNGISGVSASLDSSGYLSISATSSSNGIAINDMTSSVGGGGFSEYFGMNDLVTGTGAANFAVDSSILSGAAGLPTGTLDNSATLTTGSQVLTSGSATIINQLYDKLTGSTSFSSAGGLSATTGSFADYAAAIVANVASKATQASSNYTAKSTAQASYASSLSSQSGVNIDEETARVSSLQNKYAAASQLISVVNSMFSSLLTAVQST